MSESHTRKHSVGKPFWIGCFVGPILFLLFLAVSGVLRDGIFLELFALVAVAVFASIGGAISQVVSDLIAAKDARLQCRCREFGLANPGRI